MLQEPAVRNETCGQAWVINGEKHLLTNAASQVLCWAHLRGSAVAQRHYYCLFLVCVCFFLFCWQLQRRWQWQEKNRNAWREICYHFALYKFHADCYGIECWPSRWEADHVNDDVSTAECCDYEPLCAYRSVVNIHDVCVCVCMYVRMQVCMWHRLSYILSFYLRISNRCHLPMCLIFLIYYFQVLLRMKCF